MSAGDRDTLAAELADCTMDIRLDADTVARVALGPTIAANIVEMVLASDWLAGVRRDAFDEGWNECVEHRRTCDYQGPGECPDMPDPYRTTEDTGANLQT